MPTYPVFQKSIRNFRIVMVPSMEMRKIEFDPNRTKKALELVFKYGQNDFQPVPEKPSVSMGDVVEFEGKNYLVDAAGFKELPEYEAYMAAASKNVSK